MTRTRFKAFSESADSMDYLTGSVNDYIAAQEAEGYVVEDHTVHLHSNPNRSQGTVVVTLWMRRA